MNTPQPLIPSETPSPQRPEGKSFPAPLFLRPEVLLLAIAALFIFKGALPDEFHFFGDEMRHGFTGVFFRDVYLDLPVSNPVKYAREYYAKYPALGIPHWPPAFYAVEGLFYLVFGISAFSSRLTILFYALLAIFFWYRIAERQGPRHRAWLSALIFSVLPSVLLFERATMLEIPKLATCLGAVHFWLRYLEKRRPLDIWATGAFAALAMLTSQKAVFLVFFLGLHFLVERPWNILRRWHAWLALLASLAVVVPWYMLTVESLSLSYERVTGNQLQHLQSNRHIFYYIKLIPEQLGWPLTMFAMAGLGAALFYRPWKSRFMLTWVLATYLCYTFIQEKDPRHTMIWVPALVYLAVEAVETLFVRAPWSRIASGALALALVVQGWQYDRTRLVGMEEIAKYVSSLPESDIVYYQGLLNGNFIFYMRKHDPEKRRMVAREKQVMATRVVPGFGTRQVLNSPEEFIEMCRTWGIRYAVVESVSFDKGLAFVNQALHSEHFELVRSVEPWRNYKRTLSERIMIYRLKGELKRTSEPVTIPMMTLRSDITVKLDDLVGHPWPR